MPSFWAFALAHDRKTVQEVEFNHWIRPAIERQQRKERQEQAEANQNFQRAKLEELEIYKKQILRTLLHLKTKSTFGIELLTPAGSTVSAASLAGHSTLRFLLGSNAFEDIVIGPEAFIHTQSLDYTMGLSGGYTVLPVPMNFISFLERYHSNEFRSIIRTAIPTTKEQRALLINAFIQLIENPALYNEDGYKFLTNNCASVIKKAFAYAGIVREELVDPDDMQKIGVLGLIPSPASTLLGMIGTLSMDTPFQLLRTLYKLDSTSLPSLVVPSIEIFYDDFKMKTNRKISDKPENWSYEDHQDFKGLSTTALYMLYVGPIKMDSYIKGYVARILRTRKLDLEEIYNVRALDPILYSVCTTAQCIDQQMKVIFRTWTREQLESTAIQKWGLTPLWRLENFRLDPIQDHFDHNNRIKHQIKSYLAN